VIVIISYILTPASMYELVPAQRCRVAFVAEMLWGYARCFTDEQDLGTQRKALPV